MLHRLLPSPSPVSLLDLSIGLYPPVLTVLDILDKPEIIAESEEKTVIPGLGFFRVKACFTCIPGLFLTVL